MPSPVAEAVIASHLDHWKRSGLITSWTSDQPNHYRVWTITWRSGRITTWQVKEIKALAVGIDEMRKLSDA